MSATMGTLMNLAIYVALVAVGVLLGSRPFCQKRELPWLGKFQFLALMLLIAALGVKLGANEEVVTSLGSIGLSALFLTVMAMAGSLLCVLLVRKYLLKLDRWGRHHEDREEGEEKRGPAQKVDHSSTFFIVGAVVLGMAAGRFLLPPQASEACGTIIDFGLYLLLFLVGVDMGKQGGVWDSIRQAGFGVLLIPVAVVAGTFAGAVLAGLFLPMGIKDSMAASAGLGWYSLAPTLLEKYSLSVSAVSFLSNVMREIFSILLVPVIARRIGYVEAVAPCGATAMDTLLPMVVSSTSERITVYSFVSGVVLSLAVPVLVSAVVALPL